MDSKNSSRKKAEQRTKPDKSPSSYLATLGKMNRCGYLALVGAGHARFFAGLHQG